MTIHEKVLRTEHPETATCLNNLASLCITHAKCTEAEPLYQRVTRIFEKTLGHEHIYTAVSLNNLAMLYREQSRYEEAKPLYQRALAIRKKTLGSDYPATLDIQCDGMKGVRFFLTCMAISPSLVISLSMVLSQFLFFLLPGTE